MPRGPHLVQGTPSVPPDTSSVSAGAGPANSTGHSQGTQKPGAPSRPTTRCPPCQVPEPTALHRARRGPPTTRPPLCPRSPLQPGSNHLPGLHALAPGGPGSHPAPPPPPPHSQAVPRHPERGPGKLGVTRKAAHPPHPRMERWTLGLGEGPQGAHPRLGTISSLAPPCPSVASQRGTGPAPQSLCRYRVGPRLGIQPRQPPSLPLQKAICLTAGHRTESGWARPGAPSMALTPYLYVPGAAGKHGGKGGTLAE